MGKRVWTEFERAELDDLTMVNPKGVRVNVIDTLTVGQISDYKKHRVEWWQNNLYCVQINRGEYVPCAAMNNTGQRDINWPTMIWLSIRRRERARLPRDWRDLQRIKNELVGYEHEAVELFPAESRLVDESDQFHLWVFKSSGVKFPFGYTSRSVSGPERIEEGGGSQRAFDEGDLEG